MTVSIYKSSKFNHARIQFFAEAGGHTLLRLTCGYLRGESGGVIKTATASDLGFAPVYRNREKLISAMVYGLIRLGFEEKDVVRETDGKRRAFGEITIVGPQDDLIEALHDLAVEMETHLIQSPKIIPREERSDLKSLYDDLCVEDGLPVYLADGVYLDADGRMFE